MSNAQEALPALGEYWFTYLTPQELPLVQTLSERSINGKSLEVKKFRIVLIQIFNDATANIA